MQASEPGLLVLHTLRLVGFADAATVAARLGLDPTLVDDHLGNAADDGFARERTGTRAGWSLTEEGRKENERLLAEELDRAGHRVVLTGLYHRFGPLNRSFLELCTAWQVIDPAGPVLNRHHDLDYDRSVIEGLAAIDAEAQPLCADLGRLFDRHAGYGPRLADALARVQRGEHDWFTKPTIDSYHTIWFELHEDLLATLGLDRSVETSAAPHTENHRKEP